MRPRRLALTSLLAALMLAAALAGAGVAHAVPPATIHSDCAADEDLDGTYSLADLTEALRTLPEDLERYTACGTVIAYAIVVRGGTPPPPPPAPAPPAPPPPPTTPAPRPAYGIWDLRRTPRADDCGNLNARTRRFHPLTVTRNITAFNVKRRAVSCSAARALIVSRALRGYRTGRRSARGYSCVSRATVNRSVGRRVRTITCRGANRRLVRWQVRA